MDKQCNRIICHSKTTLSAKDFAAVKDSLTKRYLTKGPLNKLFEHYLGNTIQIKHIVSTSSGTAAFYRILLALKVTQFDEILIPDYICNSLLGPIKAVNAVPVTYDNEKNSWISSNEKIVKKITKKTKAVIINHTFGYLFNQIQELRNYLPSTVFVIEDCCHALLPNSYIGKFSDVSFFSFNATKYIATGEGGAVGTNNDNIYQRIRGIEIGDKLSDINSALGLSQLSKLNLFVTRRQQIAELYKLNFQNYIPKEMIDQPSAWFRFPILVNNTDVFLNEKMVLYRKGVDSLISHHLNKKPEPNANKLFKHTISLPIYPSMRQHEIDVVIKQTKVHLKVL